MANASPAPMTENVCCSTAAHSPSRLLRKADAGFHDAYPPTGREGLVRVIASQKSVDALLDVCEADIVDTLAAAKGIGDGARGYGVPLIAYEAAQHIRDDRANAAAQTIYNEANDAPRMGDLHTAYLNQWRADGGQMVALFSLISGQSVYGRWALLVAQPESLSGPLACNRGSAPPSTRRRARGKIPLRCGS